jgi:curved DNA-binding protein CbpA
MSNYYEIIGLNKLASTEEIIKQHALLKELNKLNEKIEEAFFVLTDYHRRKKYDSILEKKSIFSALFTNDLLVNILNGNSSFIGDTNGVKLSPTTIENYQYQKLGIGATFN